MRLPAGAARLVAALSRAGLSRAGLSLAGLCLATLWVTWPLAAAGAAVPAQAAGDTSHIQLASQNAWLSPGDDLRLGLRITTRAPGRLTVAATVCQRVTSRSEFALTVQDRARCPVVTFVDPLLDRLPEGPDGTVLLSVPVEGRVDTPGVYPVRVELRAEDGHELDHLVTHLVAVGSPTPDSKLNLAWVLPIHTPPAPDPTAGRQPPAASSAALGALVQAVADHPTVPLNLRATPGTLETLAGSGRDEDAATVRTLSGEARSSPATRQLLASTYVPVDLNAMTAAGLDTEEAAQVVRGDEALDETVGARPDPRTWVTEERLNAVSAAALGDRGVDRMVLPEEGFTAPAVKRTPTQPSALQARQGRRVTAMVADGGLAAHFAAGGDQVLAAHQFLADLAVIWFDAPGSRSPRAVVALTPRRWQPDADFLRVALDGLATSPVVAPVTLDDLFSRVTPATSAPGVPAVRSLAPSPVTPDIALPADRLRAARRRLDLFGSLLDHDNQQAATTFDDLERNLLTTESADLRGRARSTALEAVTRRLEREIRLVKIPASRTITLTARRGEIPISIFSDAGFPLHVVLRVESEKLRFPSGSTRELDLNRRNTTERFTVQARTSGAFPMRVNVLSPTGELLGSSRFTVRSTAASGVGVVLSVGAGLILVTWWGRNLRHGRRARRLVPA